MQTDEMQTAHYNTLRFSVLISSVQGKKQADWDAIAERIHNAGEPGALLHLKIKAYYLNLARGDVERQGMILEQIAAKAIPRPPYLRHIDPDSTSPLEDVRKEFKAQAWLYYHLIVNPFTSKGIAESAQHGVVSAVDIYESFYYVQRQPSWAARD